MTVINSATYQGYPCKSVQFKRSDGLAPESGFVTLDYSTIKDLKLIADPVPWRDGKPGGNSIHEWFVMIGQRQPTQTADKPFTPPGSGLRLYGPLIMQSVGENGVSGRVQYDDIYVANGEEVAENLARILEHKTGELRIDLTDVRQYHIKYGCLIGRINCRLENGKYDPRTVKTPATRGRGGTTTSAEQDGTPWSFEEVVRYLFSQLPGGPSVSFTGLTGLPAPEEIDQIGAPPATVLQELLDNYGLVAKMQPNGTYFVARKSAKFITRGQVATSINKAEKPAHVAYEVKTVSRTDSPAAVMVLGGRRYRAETLAYIPVFRDLDGKLYRQSDIDRVFDGYSPFQVDRQAAKTPGKHFQDVPPQPFRRNISEQDLERIVSGNRGIPGTSVGQAQDDLHYGRRRILREQAYRVYAPVAIFEGDAPKNAKGAPYFSDLDDRVFTFLPMGPVPTFESRAGTQARRARSVSGDRGRVILAPPIVRGTLLAEALYTDNYEIAKRYASILDGLFASKTHYQLMLDIAEDRQGGLASESLRANELRGVAGLAEEGLNPKIGGSQNIFTLRLLEEARRLNKHVIQEGAGLEGVVTFYKKRLKQTEVEIDRIKLNQARAFRALALAGGVQGYGQTPWGTIPENAYTLDTSTGILTFDEVCCIVDHPLVFDQEDLTVLGDGHVTVTIGHPVDYNETADFTSVLFCKDGRGGAKLCGVNRPSAVTPHVIRDPDMVMYEEENADPMNFKSVLDQAEKKAKPILEGADSFEGFVTQFSGLITCVLERGINCVQHVWGGGAAHTFVAVHSPGWAGPAGAGETGKLLDVDGPARIAAKQVEG